MELGMVGLGRMGHNMVRRLLRGGHAVAAYNRTFDKALALTGEGARPAKSLKELTALLSPPRVFWLMLPAGPPTEAAIDALLPLVSAGDIVVEGGNSRFEDDAPRAGRLAAKGALYLDAGVSGGIWGLEAGYCTMVGGPPEAFARIEPLLRTLAPENGYMHCGPTGAGHFTKMVHNAIEYGMMQAYAEGFSLIEASPFAKGLDYAALCRLWNQGSVVRSWLLELCERFFAADPRLSTIGPAVEDSGEGRWAAQLAIDLGVPAPVLALSLFERFRSRSPNAFADRFLASLRREFGGHATEPAAPPADEEK